MLPSFLDRSQLTKGDYSQSTQRYCHKKRSKWTEYQIIGQTASQQLNSLRHIAIYAKGDTISVQQQVKQCKAYCTSNSYSIDLNQVYLDMRENINDQDRLELNPELNCLIEAAKNGLIDSIVLTNVQMFTRRPSYLATLLQLFQDIGVQVVTLE